jgi:hypothetical protein
MCESVVDTRLHLIEKVRIAGRMSENRASLKTVEEEKEEVQLVS